jgi:hypothetical protein
LLHQDRLRLLDDLAVLERGLRLLQLALQPVERVEPANRHVEDRPDTLLAQAIDDIGGDAGIDGRLHRRTIGLVDEHRDRPPREPRHLKHLLERVATRVLEVDEDDVGIDGCDARQQVGGVANVMNLERAAFLAAARETQAFLEDRCPHGVLVDY